MGSRFAAETMAPGEADHGPTNEAGMVQNSRHGSRQPDEDPYRER